MTNEGAPSQKRDESLPLPDKFFESILPRIDDLALLKVTLHLLRLLGQERALNAGEIRQNKHLHSLLQSSDELGAALEKLVEFGALKVTNAEGEDRTKRHFTLNAAAGHVGEASPAKSNVIKVYEENIGAVTPRIADVIREAENDFPQQLIIDAIGYAAERNIRNWRYIRKVLENWQSEGRGREKTGRSLERRKQYIAGEWQAQIRR